MIKENLSAKSLSSMDTVKSKALEIFLCCRILLDRSFVNGSYDNYASPLISSCFYRLQKCIHTTICELSSVEDLTHKYDSVHHRQ